MSSDTQLSPENWRRAVDLAIESLPDDISASVGTKDGENQVRLCVAVEPHPDEGEAEMAEILVTHYPTLRASYEAAIRESPGVGIESHLKYYEDHDPEMLEWPVLAIDGGSPEGATNGLFLGRAPIQDLVCEIQLRICESMFSGGARSMVSKDADGRYFHEDGTPILAWQVEDSPND